MKAEEIREELDMIEEKKKRTKCDVKEAILAEHIGRLGIYFVRRGNGKWYATDKSYRAYQFATEEQAKQMVRDLYRENDLWQAIQMAECCNNLSSGYDV